MGAPKATDTPTAAAADNTYAQHKTNIWIKFSSIEMLNELIPIYDRSWLFSFFTFNQLRIEVAALSVREEPDLNL